MFEGAKDGSSKADQIKISPDVAPEIQEVIKPWVDEMNKGGLINDSSQDTGARYADMLRQILTIAEMNGGMNSEDQVKSLKKSVTNIAKNYPPEVLAKFGPDARAFFDLDK